MYQLEKIDHICNERRNRSEKAVATFVNVDQKVTENNEVLDEAKITSR